MKFKLEYYFFYFLFLQHMVLQNELNFQELSGRLSLEKREEFLFSTIPVSACYKSVYTWWRAIYCKHNSFLYS
jgi:hypothetical protein